MRLDAVERWSQWLYKRRRTSDCGNSCTPPHSSTSVGEPLAQTPTAPECHLHHTTQQRRTRESGQHPTTGEQCRRNHNSLRRGGVWLSVWCRVPSRTGPLTLRMMDLLVSSMNSTRTCVTPPRLPVLPSTFDTRAWRTSDFSSTPTAPSFTTSVFLGCQASHRRAETGGEPRVDGEAEAACDRGLLCDRLRSLKSGRKQRRCYQCGCSRGRAMEERRRTLTHAEADDATAQVG